MTRQSRGAGVVRPIGVLMADDHRLFREGLKRILALEPHIEVIGECADGGEVVRQAAELKPDVILMDINMPEVNGIEAMKQIHAGDPTAKVIFLSIHDDKSYIIETLSAGAMGYLLKDMEPDDLVEAIEVVSKGGAYIHFRVLGKVLEELRRIHGDASQNVHFLKQTRLANKTEIPSDFTNLTKRETEVLRLLAEGKSNRAIAEALFISEKTVKNHISSILQKLGALDRTQAVILAIRHGMVQL